MDVNFGYFSLESAMKGEKLFGTYGYTSCSKCRKVIASNCLKKHACSNKNSKPWCERTPAAQVEARMTHLYRNVQARRENALENGTTCLTCGAVGGHYAALCPKHWPFPETESK